MPLDLRIDRLTQQKEDTYAAVADVLYRNHASDQLIARMVEALSQVNPGDFRRYDFAERAYGNDRAHP